MDHFKKLPKYTIKDQILRVIALKCITKVNSNIFLDLLIFKILKLRFYYVTNTLAANRAI